MLARLLSLWVRHRTESEIDKTDRRVWVRFQSHLDISCEPAGPVQGERVQAQLHDISRGGIRLLLEDRVQEGDLLSVELPSEKGENCTVLACTVWVEPRGEAGWLVGGSFSAELTDEDLERWGGRRPRPTPPEQRDSPRFPSSVQVSFQKVRAHDSLAREGRVVDVSPSGMGLRTEESLRVGDLLSVDFRDPSGKALFTTLASVIRVTDRGAGDRLFGCTFIRELSEQELRLLS
jgi:c-di-GMP-binding flagellar brake protein YcgR